MLDVVKIVFDLDAGIIGIGGITVDHLRPATDPGPHDVTVHVERDLPFELIDEGTLLRSWPNQAHVPFKDVEELWQLVDAQLADHLAHPGDAHVTVLGKLGAGFFRILAHAAELVDAKILVPLPDPVLQEHHGARTLQLDEDRRHQHQGGEQRDRDQRGQNIHSPFDEGIDGGRQEGTKLVLVQMINLHAPGQGLADLLDVINGNVGQGAARQETLPLTRQLLIPKICHHGVITHGPEIGFVQQTPLNTLVPGQGLIVPKGQQGVFGGPVAAADEVGEPAAKQGHQIRLEQYLSAVRQAQEEENADQSTIEGGHRGDHVGHGTCARIAQEAMQHNPGQQKRHKGTAQGIDTDGIEVMPKFQAPSLNGRQANRKQGPEDEQGRRAE